MRGSFFRGAAAFLALAGAVVAQAEEAPLQSRVAALLGQVGPGVRFGLVVAGEDGREFISIAPEGRFVPASSTKMFTTAAVFAAVPGLKGPDMEGGASVGLEAGQEGLPNVILEGHGDARLSSAPDCIQDCLATLADAVAARSKAVRDVIGDDRFFPDERWSPGMSWNNMETRSGTAVSALTLDDNELPLIVSPTTPGQAPRADMAYYSLRNEAVTAPPGTAGMLDFERLPGSRFVRLIGTIAADSKPQTIRLGIEDPADYAAWRFKSLLEARGVRVSGSALARHRPLVPADDPAVRNGAPAALPPAAPVLARLTPPPLLQDLTVTAKVSQNLHAQLLLRRLARRGGGSGSIADGLAAVRAMLAAAGVPKAQAEFADGSGMSTYNRVAPRGAVTFLLWANRQPWGAAWRSTLPVGGVDGTLARRFKGGALEGRIFAKTGSLNQVSALAGYLIAKSGRTLAFAAFANDVPEGADAVQAMDRALELVAAEN